MLIHCIQKYVLFIARLKGFYFTYNEGKKKRKRKKNGNGFKKKKRKKLLLCDLGGPLLAFVINKHYKQTCSMA